MTADSNRDALRLNELLDQAFDLDEPARAAFVETVSEEFRDELKALLQASDGTGRWSADRWHWPVKCWRNKWARWRRVNA